MNEDMIIAELTRLWKLRDECVQKARALASDDKEATLFTKIAEVGFSYYHYPEHWQPSHRDSVKAYMTESAEAGYDPHIREYLALCYGGLQGMVSGKVIDKRLFVFGMSQLPGIAFAKSMETPRLF